MSDQQRPIEGVTELRGWIDPTDDVIPVLSTSTLNTKTRKLIGEEYVICSGFGTDAQGWPVMTGCRRGLNPEEGGVEPRRWPAGELVFDIAWSTVEIVTEIPVPTIDMIGRQFLYQAPDGNTYSFNIITSPEGDPVVDWVNEPPPLFDQPLLSPEFSTLADVTLFPYGPRDVAVDQADNLWVVDQDHHLVRKLSPTGAVLTTLGVQAWIKTQTVGGPGAGDGQFTGISGITRDAAGNLYTTETTANRIQKFSPAGAFITKQSYAQTSAMDDIAYSPADGQFFVSHTDETGAQWGAMRILPSLAFGNRWRANTEDYNGIAANRTYIFYTYNNTLQGVVRDTISSFPSGLAQVQIMAYGAANGQVQFARGVFASETEVFAVDDINNKVMVNSVAGAYLRQMALGAGDHRGIAESLDGFLWIVSNATASGPILQAWTKAGVFAGSFPLTTGKTYNGVVCDWKNQRAFWITNQTDSTIEKWEYAGIAASGTGQFNTPVSIDVRRSTNYLYIVDYGNSRVQIYNITTGAWVNVFGALGTGAGQFTQPRGVAVNQTTGKVYVSDVGAGVSGYRVQRFTDLGAAETSWLTPISAAPPRGLDVDLLGNVWVAERTLNRLYKYDANGVPLGVFGTGGNAYGQLSDPIDVAVDPEGRIWVVEAGNNRVEVFDAAFLWLGAVGTVGSGDRELSFPSGLAFTSAGIGFVSDYNNQRISRIFQPDAEFLVATKNKKAKDILTWNGAWWANDRLAEVLLHEAVYPSAPTLSWDGFNADFKEYRVRARLSYDAVCATYMRMRVANADVTTAAYLTADFYMSTVLGNDLAGNVAYTVIGFTGTTGGVINTDVLLDMIISNPFETDETLVRYLVYKKYAGGVWFNHGFGATAWTTPCSGFTLLQDTGNVGGRVKVLGIGGLL